MDYNIELEKEKVYRILIVLVFLLIFDAIVTVTSLFMFEDAMEMNPFLTFGGNVIVNVIISHILAIGLIYWCWGKFLSDEKIKNKINFRRMTKTIAIFYFIVALTNSLQIGYALSLLYI